MLGGLKFKTFHFSMGCWGPKVFRDIPQLYCFSFQVPGSEFCPKTCAMLREIPVVDPGEGGFQQNLGAKIQRDTLQGAIPNQLGVSKNRGTPKWMVYNGKPY